MTLQSSLIKGTSGEIYAHIFENPSVGVPRGLYWAVTLECEPVLWNGEAWPCSITCEWLQWPIHHWQDLHGMGLHNASVPEGAECSLYFAEHNPVRLKALALKRVPDTPRFAVEFIGTVDLDGFEDLDGTNISFAVQGEVEFTGILVIPDNLTPKPTTAIEASCSVSQFMSLDTLKEPRWDRFKYVFEPA